MSEQETFDHDTALLQHELDEAHKTIRTLLRQLSKEQARSHETTRAYNMTVSNLAEITRENSTLSRERDQWRAKAEGQPSIVFESHGPFPALTVEEVAAIRKAIARLHHPDAGGNAERMKLWNAVLDSLDR